MGVLSYRVGWKWIRVSFIGSHKTVGFSRALGRVPGNLRSSDFCLSGFCKRGNVGFLDVLFVQNQESLHPKP